MAIQFTNILSFIPTDIHRHFEADVCTKDIINVLYLQAVYTAAALVIVKTAFFELNS